MLKVRLMGTKQDIKWLGEAICEGISGNPEKEDDKL